MSTALNPSQRVALVGAIDPQSANAVKTSAWIDATKFFNYLAIVSVGALGASATVDAKLEQATASDGTGAKDVPAHAITQLTKAGNKDSKQVEINLKQEDLDFDRGFKFFRLSVTPAVAASLISGTVLGLDPRYGVASDSDAASVDEIVA